MIMREMISKEESIKLASFLADTYSNSEEKKAEYKKTLEKLDKLNEYEKVPQRTVFRYFWPFLLFSFIVVLIIFLIVERINPDYIRTIIFAISEFCIWLAIIIFGVVVSKKRRNAVNEKICDEFDRKSYYEIKLKELNKELIILKTKTEEYNDIVPSTMRNRDCMETVKRTLENGMAENFKEAISCLKPVGH